MAITQFQQFSFRFGCLLGWFSLLVLPAPSGAWQNTTPDNPNSKTPPAANSASDNTADPNTTGGKDTGGDGEAGKSAEGNSSGNSAAGEPLKSDLKISFDEIAKRLGRFRDDSRYAGGFEQLFQPLSASVAPSTVQVFVNNRQVSIGTIVDRAGLILTKASELKSPLECRLENGQKLSASVLGIDSTTDLALLKVESPDLTPANLVVVPAPEVGSWLATVAPEPKPLTLGVVGVREREILHARAYIGIMPANMDDRPGVRISQVTAGAPADSADLLVNDVIMKINDRETKAVDELRKILAEFSPGDRITLTVERGDKTFTVDIELANMENIDPDFERSNQQNRMGSTLSKRRQDFPMAFQHDSGIQANQCGGPVVDSSGRIVGINIARSGRVSSLALPMQVVLPAIERMRGGELAPAVIYKNRLTEIEKELTDLAAQLAALPATVADAESKQLADEVRKAEVERMAAELKTRLEEIDQSLASQTAATKKAKEELKALQRRQQKLLDEQRDLSFGANK